MTIPTKKHFYQIILFSKIPLGLEEEYSLNTSSNITEIIFYEIINNDFKF